MKSNSYVPVPDISDVKHAVEIIGESEFLGLGAQQDKNDLSR